MKMRSVISRFTLGYVLEHTAQYRAQLRAVVVAVCGDGVCDSDIQQFVGTVRAQGHRAVHVTRIVAAIDNFAH